MMMNGIFRCVVEAGELKSGHCLVVMFNRSAKRDEGDWVGSAYVKASSEGDARRRFTRFFMTQSSKWSLEGGIECVATLEEYELDHEAMSGRDDIRRLMDGALIVGCGM